MKMPLVKSIATIASKSTLRLTAASLAASLVLFCQPTRAEIIHLTYSGDSFTYPYTTDRFGHHYIGGDSIFGDGPITGELVLDLPANFSGEAGSFVKTYSFSAGHITFGSGGQRQSGSIKIGISYGEIYNWNIAFSNANYGLKTKYWFDGTEDVASSPEITVGNRNQSGRWTVSSVPEPASYGMMLLGLAGVGCAALRRGRLHT
jgi:hypothetical protein